MAVITAWIVAAISGVLRLKNKKPIIAISYLSVVVFGISCIVFIVFSYLSLYHEILRHQKIIKTPSTNIAKRSGKIRQGAQSTQDNRVCGRYRSAVSAFYLWFRSRVKRFQTSYVNLSLYTMDSHISHVQLAS